MAKLQSALTKQYSFFFNADQKTRRVAIVFFLFLLLFEVFTFQTGFSRFFEYLSTNQDYVFTFVCVFHLIVSLYLSFIFFLFAFGSKWQYAALYFLILAFSTFYEYGYQKALGKFTDLGDVIVALSATNDQKFDSIFAFINFAALIPCLAFVLLSLLVKKRERRLGGKCFALVLALICPFYIYISFINQAFLDQRFPNVSFGAFCQTAADFVQWGSVSQLSPTKREEVEAPRLAADYVPNNNVIFVFDESIRGDHLSLNGYSRSTTPYLEELNAKGLLKNWGIAAAASTSSHPSYNAVITGATPDSLGGTSLKSNSSPTIFQYAKAMNYRTHLFDGQMKSYWGGNQDDLKYIDNFVTLKELNPNVIEDWELGDEIRHEIINDGRLQIWEIDNKIAQLVKQVFNQSTGNFIFIYKRGSHFPYEKNYPAQEAVWKPVYLFRKQYEIPSGDKYQEIVNSYDNSLKYNLDSFFKTLADDYTALPNNTVIIYTGDHGQSFYVNQKATHGGKTREEANVPLFMLGNLPSQPDVNFKASHCNIFTTMLDLMNYPAEKRKRPYAVSLLKATAADSQPRYYNPHLGEKIPFD